MLSMIAFDVRFIFLFVFFRSSVRSICCVVVSVCQYECFSESKNPDRFQIYLFCIFYTQYCWLTQMSVPYDVHSKCIQILYTLYTSVVSLCERVSSSFASFSEPSVAHSVAIAARIISCEQVL